MSTRRWRASTFPASRCWCANGEIVRAQGFGFANVELRVAVKPETIFQSGSVGKQFTATAIMMLVEEGKIGLDDSIAKYFPEARQAGSRSQFAIC